MALHSSLKADKLRCRHCGEEHATDMWPIHGDDVPFHAQDEPGTFSLGVSCPHCGTEWYVVWDEDPGPELPLGAP